jgi:hypothetical protein
LPAAERLRTACGQYAQRFAGTDGGCPARQRTTVKALSD